MRPQFADCDKRAVCISWGDVHIARAKGVRNHLFSINAAAMRLPMAATITEKTAVRLQFPPGVRPCSMLVLALLPPLAYLSAISAAIGP